MPEIQIIRFFTIISSSQNRPAKPVACKLSRSKPGDPVYRFFHQSPRRVLVTGLRPGNASGLEAPASSLAVTHPTKQAAQELSTISEAGASLAIPFPIRRSGTRTFCAGFLIQKAANKSHVESLPAKPEGLLWNFEKVF